MADKWNKRLATAWIHCAGSATYPDTLTLKIKENKNDTGI